MGEPIGRTPISGVLSCWFDDEPAQVQSQAAVATAPVQQAPEPVSAPILQAVQAEPATPSNAIAAFNANPQPVQTGQQASARLMDLMEAINDRHMLPNVLLPSGGRHDAPLMRPEPDNQANGCAHVPAERPAPVRRASFQDLITNIFHSQESRSYQFLQAQGLAVEFDQRGVSLEQRWNTDGSFCAVRRTANGYSHTVMLKSDGSSCGERITGPSGPIAQVTAQGAIVMSESSNPFSRSQARQTA